MFSKSYNHSDKRNKQINTLKVFNENVYEKVPGEEYQVEPLAGDFSLIIKLPPNFPESKPCITIVPTISHPWVDEKTGEVSKAPGLLSFTEHSDLGRVVHAIVRELAKRQQQTGTPVKHPMSPPSAPNTSVPDLNLAVNEQSMLRSALAALSVAQLQALKESEDQCDEFLEQLPPIKILEDEIDRIILENEQLAKETLEQEARLAELKDIIQEKVEKVQKLNNQYEDMSISYQQLSNKFMPSAIKESLHASSVECDQQSDKLAEQFLEGEMDTESFLNDYVNSRTISHTRRVKEEKLGKQLHDLEKASY
ncbi:vacuolar protein sorting-associated protein 37A [Neocloeon triangulifer]|uniref:vacuolar protein sorting-associated protein 37A n=1 Tax=Neocloeon triangulifer TaxID=2078957 RepID=UPI00286EF2C1|nr:vacuolar protein sorting-associated protein 37A [Neocloeon triangulifer]